MFAARNVRSSTELETIPDGRRVAVAGIVLVRQRPGKGNAIFVTLEDEGGVVNVLIWARLFDRHRRTIIASRLMLVEGEVQRSEEGVTHVIASNVFDRSGDLDGPAVGEAWAQNAGSGHPRTVRIIPASRDFH